MTDPKICILTQTATELPAYYREFFKGFDLFFITFKQENPDALAFLPGSTMHEGRNYMWERVKGKYDYYLFIDDDQVFHEWRPWLPLKAEIALKWLQRRIRFARFVPALARLRQKDLRPLMYRKASPQRFKAKLLEKIQTYKPMVVSVRSLATTTASDLDEYALRRNRRVRRLAWFDAQVTLLSETAASLLLPYIPGWWSPQVPTYCLSYLAFQDRAIYILDIAASNENHLSYRPGFDGRSEVREVTQWLAKGFIAKELGNFYNEEKDFVNCDFGSEAAEKEVVPNGSRPADLESALATLGASFDLHHPYIYERHKGLVDALDARRGARQDGKAAGKETQNVHG